MSPSGTRCMTRPIEREIGIDVAAATLRGRRTTPVLLAAPAVIVAGGVAVWVAVILRVAVTVVVAVPVGGAVPVAVAGGSAFAQCWVLGFGEGLHRGPRELAATNGVLPDRPLPPRPPT